MTDKELKKLRRGELLELLLEQSRELDRLNARVKELEEERESRIMLMRSAGSLAEEAMKLNHIFEAAQRSADQYLENIRHYGARLAEQEPQAEDTPAPQPEGSGI